jgi:hypothetical protein
MPYSSFELNENQQALFEQFSGFLTFFEKRMKAHPVIAELCTLLDINVGIAGGAIRDLIAQKEIKDIDLVVSLNFMARNEHLKALNITRYPYRGRYSYEDKVAMLNFVPDLLIDYARNKSLLTEKELEDKNNINADQIAVRMLTEFFKECFQVEHVYDSTLIFVNDATQQNRPDLSMQEYQAMGISAVIKMKTPVISWPVDVIITCDSIHQYVESFDFNICKAWMQHKLTINENRDILRHSEFEIITPDVFAKDLNNKNITYPLHNFTSHDRNLQQAYRSFTKHLPRLLKKFPDYDIQIVNNSPHHPEMEKKLPEFQNILERAKIVTHIEEKYANEHDDEDLRPAMKI